MIGFTASIVLAMVGLAAGVAVVTGVPLPRIRLRRPRLWELNPEARQCMLHVIDATDGARRFRFREPGL